MATTYNNVRLSQVKSNGDVAVLYPQNAATDVIVTPSSKMSSGDNTLQKVCNKLTSVAFTEEEKIMQLGYGETPFTYPTDIDDVDDYRTDKTLSSHEIDYRWGPLEEVMNDDRNNYVRIDKSEGTDYNGPVYNSEVIDSVTTESTTWSSVKIYNSANQVVKVLNADNLYDAKGNFNTSYVNSIVNDYTKRYKWLITMNITRDLCEKLDFYPYEIGKDYREKAYVSIETFPAIDKSGAHVACYQTMTIVFANSREACGRIRFYMSSLPNKWFRWLDSSIT